MMQNDQSTNFKKGGPIYETSKNRWIWFISLIRDVVDYIAKTIIDDRYKKQTELKKTIDERESTKLILYLIFISCNSIGLFLSVMREIAYQQNNKKE